MKKIFIFICGLVLLLSLVLGRHYYSNNISKITLLQRTQISAISREARKDNSISRGKIIFIFLLYGLVHSLGPGHGKSIVSGIFLSNKSKFTKVAIFSGIICYSQGFMAFLMVKAFTLLGKSLLPMEAFKTEETLRFISAFFILIIGSFMLYKYFFKPCDHSEDANKSSIGIVILLGLTPCFGTVNLLLFLGALGLSSFQLIGTLSISTGMFISVTLVGILTTTFKDVGKFLGVTFIRGLELVGPLIMIVYSFSILKNNLHIFL